ncbi:TPA: glycosyltransferase family 4 protein [Burkholderia aenigmatica]|uniref:glycosyltransferase family 4 protein n=1 Tax=Burkholderia sp. AU45251 TaxID=3059204 RepID=UPI00264F8515|nr:glycosyltransferase family 4 protein [Burkholderia sp. AU45251]HDR9488098.1 glycosyltransferase family 4 protein [Burkholderia aenigmatica]MDN7520862.1 glycosyltransferase family 4 protein [Burkholderia sp. AU45251]HDR9519816.1 glycosyltransferase family 4 protein [Burkholderia aenigmatica]HDR9596846.1 glycosyltransferase family 4 protein [Burkholderia aenigmatica]HDR9604682.1 glycosyltransferase family 4 protein [Burkholderia aenigmatica]
MRIAQIAPLTESVPPKLYGGTERVVSYITEALVELGHDVTLFASGDSTTRAKLEPVWPRALRLDSSIRDRVAPHMLLMETVARRAKDFDVLHFHMDYYSFSVFNRQETPYVTTLHGRLDLPEQQPVFDTFNTAPVISISNAQRQPLPQAKWLTTVYHGLPDTLYMPQPVEPRYLAFLGRISPEKRVDTAIRIARQCGLPIKIAAKIDSADQEYFEREIKPLFALPHVEYIGEIADHQKAEFLSGAHALLFPIDWPEPFGLVMIEAMSCGTPVIAFNRGAVPEVVDEGVSGFIVEDEISAVAAVNRLHLLPRARVRQRFEARFTSRRMAQQYVDVYQSVIRAQKRSRFKVIDSTI